MKSVSGRHSGENENSAFATPLSCAGRVALVGVTSMHSSAMLSFSAMNAQEEEGKKAGERKKRQGSADLRLRGLRLDWSYSPRRAYSSGTDFHSLVSLQRERVFPHERGATNAALRVDDCYTERLE